MFVFFFQAEDGIRDVAVTGVQTCALPICSRVLANGQDGERDLHALAEVRGARVHDRVPRPPEVAPVDRRLRPEARGDLATERVLGLAEIARVQGDRLCHTVNGEVARHLPVGRDRKSTRLNSSHGYISYAVFCLKKKKKKKRHESYM